MGLRSARTALIGALESGSFEHEAREAEKNLLAVGDVDADFVVRLLRRTRGNQYSCSPHDWDSQTEVHVFRPTLEKQTWYVKAYFLGAKEGQAMFISVHHK